MLLNEITEHIKDPVSERILEEFKRLADIPRPSRHEKAVSDYIVSRLKEMGLTPVQDEVYNVIADKPASAGFENAPRTILQAHLDMVCVAAEGTEFEPLTDSVKIVRDGNRIYADGTSLGADDGIGVGIILSILGDKTLRHGPLRAIFTADEETGMTGAEAIGERYLDGKYLINVDWEDSGSVCTSSADSTAIEAVFVPEWIKPENNRAFTVEVKGLLGGHSGLEIDKNRANAIKLAAGYLQALSDGGVSYELSEISGGIARNAIPAAAKAVFVIKEENMTKAFEILGGYTDLCADGYGHVEKGMSIVMSGTELPARVMKNGGDLVRYLSALPINVNSMSPVTEGLVESSSNMGIIKTSEGQAEIQISTRSSSEYFSRSLIKSHKNIAEAFGLEFRTGGQSPGWKQRASSGILPVLQEVYKTQTGMEIFVKPIHAGLECGYFANKNPELDIVSIGPTLTGAHSPEETLYYDSIAVTYNLLTGTLALLK